MMHRLLVIAAALCLAFASTASAGVYDPGNSYLGFKLGSIPLIIIDSNPDTNAVRLVEGGGVPHAIEQDASVFQTTNFFVNSAAFTGFPLLSGLKITIHTGSGDYSDGFSTPNPIGGGNIAGLGGYSGNTGAAVLFAAGFEIPIPLGVLGAGGTTSISPVLNNQIKLTGAPFGTEPVQITGISTNILFSPSRGTTGLAFTLNLTTVELITAWEVTAAGVVQEATQLTVTGTNTLASASQPGMVTLVSPYRVSTGTLAGNIAGAVYLKYVFVPEPGTMLLLVSGAVGLAVIGRKRMRK